MVPVGHFAQVAVRRRASRAQSLAGTRRGSIARSAARGSRPKVCTAVTRTTLEQDPVRACCGFESRPGRHGHSWKGAPTSPDWALIYHSESGPSDTCWGIPFRPSGLLVLDFSAPRHLEKNSWKKDSRDSCGKLAYLFYKGKWS